MHRILPFALFLTFARVADAQTPASTPSAISAPVSDIRYEVTFTPASAGERLMHVVTTFTAAGTDPILLSLPAWTPGAYEISNFARWVENFSASVNGKPLRWDKLDYDTWRIRRVAVATSPVTVEFDYRADSLDNAMSWARPDFLLFNGTNVFMYPEGRPLNFTARVTVVTASGWKVTTSMPRVASTGSERGATFTASTYHDLVDMPFFVGEFDVDSATIAGKWMRFASYPSGAVRGVARFQVWDQLKKAVPTEVAVFGETPWDSYTVFEIIDSTYQGASGLEHQSSHVDVLSPLYVSSEFQPSLYAHEIFHAWNVKRLRPSDLWPYHYDAPQPTAWLWVSEGITDYYADLAEVRGGIVNDSGFYALTAGKINEVNGVPPVALEDASLNTWVHPVDGTGYIYYPKGSLAGFLLDVLVRDASDNRRSLDNVMRELYTTAYKQGRGFTPTDWWGAISRAAGGKSFDDFQQKYVDGREPYPWNDVLPLAGLRVQTTRVPRLGVSTIQDQRGVLIEQLDPNGAAAAAGARAGDYLLAVNDISVEDQSFGPKFRAAFADAQEGQKLTLRVRRGEETLTLTGGMRFGEGEVTISADPNASPKAVRIRTGILRGTTDR
ncbi:MAG TPA: PDZ domain-containing protein [Gemmatimonadaceae bacterium]|nr:PDZ domain-containing protein [Gemmatimonadaceae bacterium]